MICEKCKKEIKEKINVKSDEEIFFDKSVVKKRIEETIKYIEGKYPKDNKEKIQFKAQIKVLNFLLDDLFGDEE